MPFEKGDERINRTGRPHGAKNRINDEIRTRIKNFLDENFETIQTDIKNLEPRDRVKFFLELLQYSLPKLQSVELTPKINEDKISEEDINKILDYLEYAN